MRTKETPPIAGRRCWLIHENVIAFHHLLNVHRLRRRSAHHRHRNPSAHHYSPKNYETTEPSTTGPNSLVKRKEPNRLDMTARPNSCGTTVPDSCDQRNPNYSFCSANYSPTSFRRTSMLHKDPAKNSFASYSGRTRWRRMARILPGRSAAARSLNFRVRSPAARSCGSPHLYFPTRLRPAN